MIRTCSLCKEDLASAITVGRKARGDRDCHRVACSKCGLVQHLDLPTEDELSEYYRVAYRQEHGLLPMMYRGEVVESTDPRYEEALDSRARQLADLFGSMLWLAPGSRALEIGCGDGRVAAAMAMNGVLPHAIEPDIDCQDQARKRGITIVDFVKPDELYDATYMIHVLEHLRDPVTYLSALRSLVKSNGWIGIEVPSAERPYGELESWFYQWAHLYDFTPSTLAATLLYAGWVDVEVMHSGNALLARARNPLVPCRPELDEVLSASGANPDHATEVVGSLAAYDEQQKLSDAARAFMRGETVDPVLLRKAILLAMEEGRRASEYLDSAREFIGSIVQDIDDSQRGTQHDEIDPWQQGYVAGRTAALSSICQLLGHLSNATYMGKKS